MAKPRIEYDEDGNAIDLDTGEILSGDKPKKKVYGDSYFQVYPAFWGAIRDLGQSGTDVLSELYRWFPSNSVELVISSSVREKLEQRLGCSRSKIDRGLSELVDSHLLIRTGRGSYQINPEMIWKGYFGARIREINNRPIGFKNGNK